jgi:hypothetical protein
VLGVDRPWANALSRLLAQRHLQKGKLADLCLDGAGKPMRPGTISAVANSPKAPDVATLQRLADGLTKFDRATNPQAPPVELWEFFVSDEQAALLHQAKQAQSTLIKREEVAALFARAIAPEFDKAVDRLAATLSGSPVPRQAPTQDPAPQEHTPPADVARGKPRRRSA